MLCLLNVGLLGNRFITGEYKKSSMFWMLLFLFATDHRHFFALLGADG